jgi:Zn-dependent peptidase ImmA (M78 family)
LNFKYIKGIIENLKKKYKTECPYELANDLGITLIVCPLGKPLGMYKYINKNKVIYINSILNEYQRRYVLAHEIGHAILHLKSSCFFTSTRNLSKLKKEYEANIFASELLINFDVVDSLYIQGYSIGQLSSYYRVPVELIEFKFKESRKLQ